MKHKILLVDDQRVNLLTLEKLLEPLALESFMTTRTEEVLPLLQKHDFTLALIDVRMPGMNGFELVKKIRSDSKFNGLPVLFISGENVDQHFIREGYLAGAVDYLCKPLEPEILRSKVNSFCAIKEKELLIRIQSEEIQRQKERLEHVIAERSQIEEAQQESEMRYRTLVELSPEALAVQVQNKLVFFNNATLRVLGEVDVSSLTGKSMVAFLHQDDRDIVGTYLENVERRGGRAEPIEARIQRNNSVVYVVLRAGCVLYEGKIGVQIALQDITQRKALEDDLRKLSQLDGLTGLANRRAFNERIENEWYRAIRNKSKLSIILLDIDAFKSYNDHYGHQQGDLCICAVANVFKQTIRRPDDLAARYGGEEFIIILPETEEAGALLIAEQMRRQVEELALEHKYSPVGDHVTVSLGVSTTTPDINRKLHDLILTADQALYQAKESGRNRLVTTMLQ